MDAHEPLIGSEVVSVASGTPAWITAELISETITVWQPYYTSRLTPSEAVEILRRVGCLAECTGDIGNGLNVVGKLTE
jgi:hypothetical protein